MEIFINYPQTADGKKELEESLAKFHATLILEKVKKLDYSDNIKNKLLNLILADIKDKLEWMMIYLFC